jgi:HAD superfamily hydrolase (TIGR01509 family)
MITTLIFDLDGLQAYQDVFQGLGIALSAQQYEEHWIRDGKGITDFIQEHELPLERDPVHRKKMVRYKELVISSVQPMPGALAALELLSAHKTMALATSSCAEGAIAVLETLGIQKYFACTATKESAERAKPFPDLFLWVASTLNVDPAECLVLEDAEKGIIAAHAAGMRSVAVPNTHTRNNDFSRATMVLSSLDELTLETIQELR